MKIPPVNEDERRNMGINKRLIAGLRSASPRGGINKKAITYFELTLIILSSFSFAFLMGQFNVSYVAVGATKDVSFFEKFLDKLSEPLVPVVSAVISIPTVCCEKTLDGAYCVNTNESECNPSFRESPTSCETTSYCQLGTCYDSDEGICMGNTPQNVCNDDGGIWDPREVNEVPQCKLGCCLIEDQAAFVPLVRCKKLSSLFGVENNYRTDITSELACIVEAQSQDTGACVYEKDFVKVCEFTTRADCGASEEVESITNVSLIETGDKKFYKDMLCSAEELGTTCARQTSTICQGGDVYFQDSCENLENVYSSDKEKSWNNGRVIDAKNVCSANDGSNNNCGNCDYLLGTRCDEWEGILGVGKPAGSDHFCRKTECVDRNGNQRLNGEGWCVYDGAVGNSADDAGSRHFKEVCVDGTVRVEPCEDFRNEICVDGSIETNSGDFGTANCRVNRWQDCVQQLYEDDC